MRLRQAVLLAAELEPLVAELREALGLGEPFRDPGVGEFGLHNAVFALGDCFLEVISPNRPGTAGERWLERHGGDGGYMVIFDLEDLASARERVAGMGVRVVWQIDLPDISGTHLHPGDMGGAIVSLDRSDPYGSWRWGGPEWTARRGDGAPGHLAAITVAVPDPGLTAGRWGQVLGIDLDERSEGPALALDGAEVRFAEAAQARGEGIVELVLELPPEVRAGRDGLSLGGVRLRLCDLPAAGPVGGAANAPAATAGLPGSAAGGSSA